jgi:HAE1 family hydrophobic/amphiphilic exporter-1
LLRQPDPSHGRLCRCNDGDRLYHHRGGGWGLARILTGFLPIEDQGYLLVAVQLPDGASLERTQQALSDVSKIAHADDAVDHVVTIAGVSALDNSAVLANAGVAYVVLKDWSKRANLLVLFPRLSKALDAVDEARRPAHRAGTRGRIC